MRDKDWWFRFFLIGFVGLLMGSLVAFAIYWPLTHKSKSERISHLEKQVHDLQIRVSVLETKQ